MKRNFFIAAAGLLMFLFALNTSAHALNLRFNVMYTPKHPLCEDFFVPWAQQVKEVTGGRVNVTMFYSNALFSPKDALDAISSRVADIGTILPSYSRDRLLMNSVLDLPIVSSERAAVNSEVLWELYQSVPEMQNELKDVKILWVFMNPPHQLHFTNKNVEKMEDLKNVVISAGGTIQSQVIRNLGGSPEAMPMTEVYMALQRGVVDGCFLPYAPLRSQKIADLTRFHNNVNMMSIAFFVAINKSVWARISPQDQQAIEAISGLAASLRCGRIFDREQEKDVAWMIEKGDKFYNLAPEEQQLWFEKVAPIRDSWIQDAKAKGYADPEKVLDRALQLFSEKSH
jgi:TRAP-type transport system periplasmic protein